MQHPHRAARAPDLTKLPEASELRSVTAAPTDVSGRSLARVVSDIGL